MTCFGNVILIDQGSILQPVPCDPRLPVPVHLPFDRMPFERQVLGWSGRLGGWVAYASTHT